MAKLPNEVQNTIFNLLQQIANQIEEASATEWTILERYGETAETISELDELQNVREKLTERYNGLNNLLLRILEIQPIPPQAMIDLLVKTIERGQITVNSAQASIIEVKKNWGL
ncbi:hypothetical protein [Aphanothece sacrum]|uniref:Uncharacterized protein n=1 Tax=Aphanothece sacrum FPU1 TaxID=1920663 RepID=A0A401IIV7_APHSA|nr:hypothetical protein [Aphanothece sacrum]GBF81233.1 hypothetical protein AsFPU1_2645 [Aphanothece sacrum FPU1]GBF83417.1 hypothetical protein AsFPU3_0459 [Aphanothece sacrum FPU3]